LFRPYNNLSVPGMEVSEVNVAVNQATSEDLSAAFNVVLRGIGTAPEQAAMLDATFVTFWLGVNDALGSVLTGGTTEVTPTNTFRTEYRAALNVLLEQGTTDIVLANVANVSAIPFATAIPPVVVNPATQQPVLDANGNPIPLIGDAGRPLNPADELVTLQAAAFLAQGIGVPTTVGGTGLPLPDEVVLDRSELQAITRAVEDYNGVIAEAAVDAGLPLVDFNAEFESALAAGGLVQATGDVLSIRFLGGGQANPVFGLDGFHPTPKGYGHIANLFIETINAEYGAGIPLVNVAQLPSYIPSATPPAGRLPFGGDGALPGAFLSVAWPSEVDTELW
jgi:lysophospholipase L1-like esterase